MRHIQCSKNAKNCNKELLDKYKRNNDIASLPTQAANKVTHIYVRDIILLPLKHLSSNNIICALLYCLIMEQFLIQVVVSEARQAYTKGVHQ